MIRLVTECPPLMAIWSSPVLIVLQAMTPQKESSFAPGSIPSEFRENCGFIKSPWLLNQLDGVRIVTPQMMKPSPLVVQATEPAGRLGAELTLTWNFGELCSVIRYIQYFVVLLPTLMSVGLPMLPSTSRNAPDICH